MLKALRTEAGGDSTLSKYFREMAKHRVLTPEEEVEAAQEVERLEIGYWEALFSYAPAFETVASVLERQCSTSSRSPELAPLRKLARAAKRGKLQEAQQSRWDKAALALSTQAARRSTPIACSWASRTARCTAWPARTRPSATSRATRSRSRPRSSATWRGVEQRAARAAATPRTASSRRTCASWSRSRAATTAAACR